MALTLTNSEIVARFKALADYRLKADSGSTTTFISNQLIDEPDLTKYYICFISGDNYGIDRIITAFDEDTGTITFDEVDQAITQIDEICIVRNGFLSDIKQGEIYLANNLRNRGLDIDLFLTTSQLKEAHLFKTLEIICTSLMNDAVDTDVYYNASEKFRSLFETELNSLIADYDEDESGTIDEDEELDNVGQVSFIR